MTEHESTSLQQLVRILGEPNHNYKDRIFRMLVSDKRVALETYNAMNDTHYDNPEELIITTLENAIYMSRGCGHFLGQAKQPIQVYVCTP